MPSLSDRLKALGVQIGSQDLPIPSDRKKKESISAVVPGEECQTIYGQTYCIRESFDSRGLYGSIPLEFQSLPGLLAEWSGSPSLVEVKAEQLVFLDTETTGLGLGSGIFVFMVGIGRYQEERIVVSQYFVRDPGEEPAMLASLSQDMPEHPVLVTFNGKAFDIPLLNNRYILNSINSPFVSATHIDLLHLSRRLWRDRLPSRTLLNLEAQILGATRTQEDIPGWVIPQLYKDYLHTGDARLLKSVFYHNSKDILAMIGLLNHVGKLLEYPLGGPDTHLLDMINIGKLQESLGNIDEAIEIYQLALQGDLPIENRLATLKRLAVICKRSELWEMAVPLWEEAAEMQQVFAYVELAKYYEHRLKDLEQAYHWVQSALEMLDSPFEQLEWQTDLEHRMQRILRKLDRHG